MTATGGPAGRGQSPLRGTPSPSRCASWQGSAFSASRWRPTRQCDHLRRIQRARRVRRPSTHFDGTAPGRWQDGAGKRAPPVRPIRGHISAMCALAPCEGGYSLAERWREERGPHRTGDLGRERRRRQSVMERSSGMRLHAPGARRSLRLAHPSGPRPSRAGQPGLRMEPRPGISRHLAPGRRDVVPMRDTDSTEGRGRRRENGVPRIGGVTWTRQDGARCPCSSPATAPT